jgi:acetylornithine/succinyldiaminopimelate/putrescine aminotransferase
MYPIRIARAENDVLFGEDGQSYIDMFSAHGATLLGHSNAIIASSLADQLRKVWITGGLETEISIEAKVLLESFFPASHGLAGLYSTGMEAAEFAIRIARAITRKNGLIGFARSMHGKSMATAYLGWDNKDNLHLPDITRLPFVSSCSEQEILEGVQQVLATQTVSAVFVEPVQGSCGGRMASKEFYQGAARLCREHDALLVFDEILTGFYRTGTPFFFSELGFVPDIVLIGKALGNGFPVSGVVVDRRHAIRCEMLPGSTYAGNPLAAAAVAATLRQIRAMDLGKRVAQIEKIITTNLRGLGEKGITARGKGALWVLELPPRLNVDELVARIYKSGVCVGYAGQQIRLLPAATIEMDNLSRACCAVAAELHGAHDG